MYLVYMDMVLILLDQFNTIFGIVFWLAYYIHSIIWLCILLLGEVLHCKEYL